MLRLKVVISIGHLIGSPMLVDNKPPYCDHAHSHLHYKGQFELSSTHSQSRDVVVYYWRRMGDVVTVPLIGNLLQGNSSC